MPIIEIDNDVGKVAQYIEENLNGEHLYRVAKALAQLADLVWLRHHDPNTVFHPFGLRDNEG
jgi:hypothetical protein